MLEKIKEKLTSRKFWVSLISIVAGILQLAGADGNTVSVVCGACMTLIPAVIYVLTEGKLDAQGAKTLASCLSDALDVLTGERDEGTDAQDPIRQNKTQ